MNRLKALGLNIAMVGGLLVSGCAKTQTPGTSRVEIQIGNLTAMNRLMNLLVPEARAAVNSARVCFKRVKFKTEEEIHYLETLSSSDDDLSDSHHSDDSKEIEIEREEEVEFRLGEVELSSQGAEVASVVVPEGTYTRIEFEFEKDGRGCTGDKSIDVVNTNGSYATAEKIKIRLDGRFVASEASHVLSLNLNNIMDALDEVNANSQIKSKLESLSVKGSFE